jgi:hypothetical protein
MEIKDVNLVLAHKAWADGIELGAGHTGTQGRGRKNVDLAARRSLRTAFAQKDGSCHD